MIPHPPIPVLEIRPADIWLLLAAGATLELVSRGLAWIGKSKSEQEQTLEKDLRVLQYETAKKRRLGPPAFVETSKLERKVLQAEKELTGMQEIRQARTTRISKLIRNTSLSLYLIVFLVYYGIPMLALDGLKIDVDDLTISEQTRARAFLQGLLFPISYIGVGVKIARLGIQEVGVGALVVLWSSQVTTGKIIDCVEAMQ